MYFEIGPILYNEDFSYIIAKHPDNSFERDVGSGRKVVGKFITTGLKREKRVYTAYVENNPLAFLTTARKLNFSNYVHTQLSAVCPHNLRLFDKAQPLDSLIKIPDGWKRMGDIQVGDTVCTPDGGTAPVTGVFPQGMKDVYRITFEDGRFTECCDEHLWKVYKGSRKKEFILSLKEIRTWLNKRTECLHIPLTSFIYGVKQKLPLDPYILGTLLGNANFSSDYPLTVSSNYEELFKHISDKLLKNYSLSQSTKYRYTIKGKNLRGIRGKKEFVNYYKKQLHTLNLLNVKSPNRFIPERYKESSAEQRLELLQGLMDTDGSVDKTKTCSYSTTSYLLALDVQYVVRSLGGLCKITGPHYTKKGNSIFYLCFIRHKYTENFFKLSAKQEKTKNKKKNPRNKIKNIEYVEKKECQCIRIDHPDHLYITNDFISTHNTFQTALKGKNGSDISDEQFSAPMLLEAIIGPYPRGFEFTIKLFESLSIQAKILLDDINKKMHENAEDYQDAYMLSLRTHQPMSVTEFLQKIYLASYYITLNFSMVKVNIEQIEKFVIFCRSWLEKCTYRNSIINKLCRRSKDLIGKFEHELVDSQDLTKEERKTKLDGLETFLRKENLHAKRHNLVINAVNAFRENLPQPKEANSAADNTTLQKLQPITVVDLGCGSGMLLKRLTKNYNIKGLGIESNKRLVEKAKRIVGKGNRVICSNLVLPHIELEHLLPDILISIEVIEHLTKADRERMVMIIRDLFQPQEIILSTPNRTYNTVFGMEEGEKRHPDHKIEYNLEEFEKEVLTPLRECYEINSSDLLEGLEVQPSFFIYCKRKEDKPRSINRKYFNAVADMHHSVYLDVTNHKIRSHELSTGYASKQMLDYRQDIFYLAPTISPVEYDPEYGDSLEDPRTAFKYYRSKGLNFVAAEEKYMGSRGYILAFRDLESAQRAGYSYPIILNSRQGYPFFRPGEQNLLDIWEDLTIPEHIDFVVLDSEVLPWIIKARGLIKKEFLTPGQCTYLSRKYGTYGSLENTQKYLDILSVFSQPDDLRIKIFQVLAYGKVNEKGYFSQYVNCLATLDKRDNYYLMEEFIKKSKIFEEVNNTIIDLYSRSDQEEAVKAWKKYCANGGEGYVIKPVDPVLFMNNGYFIQPALKVRGKDYLRLIYGIDYLDPDYFAKVTYRKVKGKRALAAKEFELSIKILRAFLYKNHRETQKLLAAFIGMEYAYACSIDATL